MKGKLEYHLYAKFPSNDTAVRIGVFFTERAVQKVGNAMYEYADDVFYKLKPRRPDTKPYRKPNHWPGLRLPKNWTSTL